MFPLVSRTSTLVTLLLRLRVPLDACVFDCDCDCDCSCKWVCVGVFGSKVRDEGCVTLVVRTLFELFVLGFSLNEGTGS